MAIGHQLPLSGEAFHGFFLPPCFVAFDIIKYLWFQNEEGAINPAFGGLRFFLELKDLVAFKGHMAEARWRPDGGHRRQFSMRTMELKQFLEVHIRHAITPGEHESVVADVGLQALDPTTGQSS